MYNEKPGLNQLSTLRDLLRRDEHIQKHFDINDAEKLYDITSKLSLKQYKYILALLFNKKYIELNKMLKSIGIQDVNA